MIDFVKSVSLGFVVICVVVVLITLGAMFGVAYPNALLGLIVILISYVIGSILRL